MGRLSSLRMHNETIHAYVANKRNGFSTGCALQKWFLLKMSLKKEDFPDIFQSNGQSVYKLFMPFMLNNAHERWPRGQNTNCGAEHQLHKGNRTLLYSAGNLKRRVWLSWVYVAHILLLTLSQLHKAAPSKSYIWSFFCAQVECLEIDINADGFWYWYLAARYM